MSNTIRGGRSIDLNVQAGESLKVSTLTGTYTATVLAGAGAGTALATESSGGATYGPYAAGVVIRVKCSADGLVDIDVGTAPALGYYPNALFATNDNGDVTGLVDGAGNAVLSGSSADRNTLAIVGDSFCARWRVSAAGTVDYRPQGFLMWALAYSGQRMTVISDQSIAGAWVSQGGSVTPMVQQVDAAVLSGARNLLLMGGINDLSNGVSVAAIQAAFAYIVNKARSAGMRVWWCTQPQFNAAGAGYTVERQGQFFQLNDWIRSLCASQAQTSPGIVCIDTAAKVINPSSATGDYITNGVQADNLHVSNVSTMQMGKEVARVWSLYVPEAPFLLASGADDVGYSANSTNILTNGLFLTGSPTGTGWTQSVTASGSNTPSIVARSDGYGNDQQQVCVFAANNDSVVLTSGDLKANVALGDILTASCELNLSAMTATRTVRVQLAMTGTLSSKTMNWGQLDATVDKAMVDATGAWAVKLEPLQYTADMGSLTNVSLIVRAFGTGVGGVTLKIGRAAVRKLVPYTV